MSQNAGFGMNKLETNETNPKIMTSQCSPPANDDGKYGT